MLTFRRLALSTVLSGCAVPILMHATVPGTIVNTTSQVAGTGVPAGGPASAMLNAFANIPALSGWMLMALVMTAGAVARFGSAGNPGGSNPRPRR